MVCNFTQKDETMKILDAGLSDLFSELEGAKNENLWRLQAWAGSRSRCAELPHWGMIKKCVQTNFWIRNSVSQNSSLSSHSEVRSLYNEIQHFLQVLYDVLNHIKHIISESIWLPLPTDPIWPISPITYQCVTVPKMLNDTDTDTFFRYQIFSIPIPVLFAVPNFSHTGSDTTRKNEQFPVPVPIWYRYPL